MDIKYSQQIIDALRKEEFDSILELGCGNGKNLNAIAKEYNVEICGLDIDGTSIEEAKKNLQNIKLITACASTTEIPDKSYDIVFTYAVLMVCDDALAEKIIKNMIRIARKKIILIELFGEESNKDDFIYANIEVDENISEKELEYVINKVKEQVPYGGIRFARNYIKILNKLRIGKIEKKIIPKEIWPGTRYKNNGYIIKATI